MLMSVDAHLHKQRTSARTASYGAAFFSDDDDDDDDDDADDDDDVDDVGTISGKKVFLATSFISGDMRGRCWNVSVL